MHCIGLHKHYARLHTQSATSSLTALLPSIGSTAVQSDSRSPLDQFKSGTVTVYKLAAPARLALLLIE
jgi:hypothetical protein